jgi:hypothetical protein
VSLTGRTAIEQALAALGTQLELAEHAPIDIVVIGGAALNMLGFVARPTRDVDVLSLTEIDPSGMGHMLVKCSPLSDALLDAATGVGRDLGLERNWLNTGPADLLDHGLPDGFEARMTPRRYGPTLIVHFPAREDLICLKVFAAADTGVGRHTQDLAALQPTGTELLAGARWARTQDPSDGFKTMLMVLLRFMGADDQAEELSDDA